jgi:hypothetical protein
LGEKNENAKTPDSKNSMSTQEKRGMCLGVKRDEDVKVGS